MKECTYCKSQVNERASVCPYCTKNISQAHIIGQGIIGIILFAIIGYSFYLYSSFENYKTAIENAKHKSAQKLDAWYQKGNTSTVIDLNLYNKINLCSNYNEVKNLLGIEGSSTTDKDSNGIQSTTYEWRNGNSLLTIITTNGKVVAKVINAPEKVLAEPDFDKPNAICN